MWHLMSTRCFHIYPSTLHPFVLENAAPSGGPYAAHVPTLESKESCGASWSSALFVSERHHGIDTHSSPGRWARGKQCNGQDPDRNSAPGAPITPPRLIEH